jgi:hypothetical protein
MTEAMGLTIIASSPLEWNYLHTKFNKNLPSSSEVISGGWTDRQTGDFISLLQFLKSRLKKSILVHIITYMGVIL